MLGELGRPRHRVRCLIATTHHSLGSPACIQQASPDWGARAPETLPADRISALQDCKSTGAHLLQRRPPCVCVSPHPFQLSIAAALSLWINLHLLDLREGKVMRREFHV